MAIGSSNGSSKWMTVAVSLGCVLVTVIIGSINLSERPTRTEVEHLIQVQSPFLQYEQSLKAMIETYPGVLRDVADAMNRNTEATNRMIRYLERKEN